MRSDRLALRVLRQLRLETDLGKDNSEIRCINCGSLVHWEQNVCECCLSDPRKIRGPGRPQQTAPSYRKDEDYRCFERRVDPRVRIHKTFLHDGFLATIQNISQGGVQIKTKESIRVGRTIKTAFTMNGGIVKPLGLVMYVHLLPGPDRLVGLRFVKLSHNDLVLLRCFLDSRFTNE
jgi:hypothetical protein